MAKKRAPLTNRLARFATGSGQGVRVAVLQPEDSGRTIGEVCWQVLQPVVPLTVTDAAELTGRLERRSPFGSQKATGWIAGVLGGSLTDGRACDAATDDPRLRAIEDEVIDALGPDARWWTNSTHPLPRFRPPGTGREWDAVTRATFDLVLTARGNSLDLVLARTEED